MNTKVQYQVDERDKLKSIYNAKLDAKARNQETTAARIAMTEQETLSRDLFKTMRKAKI